MDNYRLMSFLSALLKIIEKIICRRLTDYLDNKNLHSPPHSLTLSLFSTSGVEPEPGHFGRSWLEGPDP